MTEKVRNYLGIAIIISLLVFAYGTWSYVGTYSKTVEPGTYRSFSVSGEGKVVAVPDVAQFTFSVITEGGTDIAKLQQSNTAKVNKAIEFVKANSVDKKDVQTEGYNLNPRYQTYGCRQGVCPPSEIVGYTITQTVSVKVRNFEKIGEVLGGVIQNGANSTSQLNFTIDDPTAMENKAREEAIVKAKAKAEAIASAGGFRVGRLLSISDSGYPRPYYGYGMGGESMVKTADSFAPPTIEAGSQDVRVTVSLTYEID